MILHTRLVSHLRSGQVSRVVYGSIIGLALVVTMEAHPPRLAAAFGTLVLTAVSVALAEVYSDVIGSRARANLGGPPEPFSFIAEEAAFVAIGVAGPAVFFVAAALGLMEYATAFTVAKWTGIALIAAYGYLAARLSGQRRLAAVLQALGVALVGGVLIALKAILH